MEIAFPYGRGEVRLELRDDAIVYETHFPEPTAPAPELVLDAVRHPIGSPPLREALGRRRPGDVVVVVSDVTRPIPYARFLPALLSEMEAAGVAPDDILILVATGMHRPTTATERATMFGEAVARYRIADHKAEDDDGLVDLPGTSRSGAQVRLNRHYVGAGFRLVTGLVESHFMAGFSGGRKAVCPGLCSLRSIRDFHGEAFLSDPRARDANLAGNPCHEEALSVARMAPPDFSLNVVLNRERELVRAFAGDLEGAHERACDLVRECACPPVEKEADVVLTSAGGHPLDATFYQSVKSMVSCLPAVREGGVAISFGSCSEGIGSPEYASLMKAYSGRWRDFLRDIRQPGVFTKDQWELQLHARALARLGDGNLHFVTDGLPEAELRTLSVHGHVAERGGVVQAVQRLVDSVLAAGQTLALLPEGPYCAPVAAPP